MSAPNCKIEVYDTDDVLDQTLTSDIIECHTKDIMTSGVGSFSFTLPAKKGVSYCYDDIGNNYKVKIYFGYGGSYTHLFSGKIAPFSSALNPAPSLSTRFFEGKSLSEILERRFKYNKRWQTIAAEDIVSELMDSDNLNLSSSIDSDETEETITVRTETYFDVLKKVSDYWYDGETQVKKDFYVDKVNVFQWKDRPIRTSGVESFTYGEDFANYNLRYDILPIKNYITVYGAATAPLPLTMDDYTDSLTDWSVSSGTLTLADEAATTPNIPKAGTYWIKCDVDVTTKIAGFKRATPRINTRDINKLKFWHWVSMSNADTAKVILYTDDSNFFTSKSGALTETAGVHFNDLSIGDGTEYDADENPTGTWELFGTPNWWDINAVGFLFHDEGGGMGDLDVYIDKLWFFPDRWIATAYDATSITNYGQRDAEYTDNNLYSYLECQQRAETLLYQQKDRVLRLDFAIPGNTNVLMGDRLTITLPPDNLSAVAFDVVSVENHFKKDDLVYQTIVHAVDTSNTRVLPALTPLDVIHKQLVNTREVTSELYSRVVR